MTRDEIKNLELGDYVLVRCKVRSRFVMSGMVMVTTRDCEKGFDAYMDEIVPGAGLVDCCNCQYFENSFEDSFCTLNNVGVAPDDWCIYSKKKDKKDDGRN